MGILLSVKFCRFAIFSCYFASLTPTSTTVVEDTEDVPTVREWVLLFRRFPT